MSDQAHVYTPEMEQALQDLAKIMIRRPEGTPRIEDLTYEPFSLELES